MKIAYYCSHCAHTWFLGKEASQGAVSCPHCGRGEEFIKTAEVDVDQDKKVNAKRTIHFKSRTRANVVHTTQRFKNGVMVCSCEGYKHVGHCWHVAAAKNWK